MKNHQKLFILGLAVFAFLSCFSGTNAATLNQTSVSLSVGQSYTVYATNVISSLYLTSNSVPSVASVSIVGNNINIYGSTTGSTNAVICDSTSICSTIYITVGGGSYSGTLSLSQTSVSTTVGQTTTVTAYNTYGTSAVLYISNNSNSSVATATVSGNIISIYGSSVGSSTITVCQSYNVSCGTLYVTVSGYGYNNYNYTNTGGINISNMTLPVGSSATLSSSSNYGYNGTGLYVSSNSNPNIVSTGLGSGTVGCTAGALYSVVTGQPCNSSNYSSTNNYAYIPGCYAGSIYSVTTGQLCSSYGNNGVSGTGSLTISAIAPGSDTLTVCQNSGSSSCSTMYITVTNNYAVPLSSSYYPTSTYNSSGIPTVYSNSSAN